MKDHIRSKLPSYIFYYFNKSWQSKEIWYRTFMNLINSIINQIKFKLV